MAEHTPAPDTISTPVTETSVSHLPEGAQKFAQPTSAETRKGPFTKLTSDEVAALKDRLAQSAINSQPKDESPE